MCTYLSFVIFSTSNLPVVLPVLFLCFYRELCFKIKVEAIFIFFSCHSGLFYHNFSQTIILWLIWLLIEVWKKNLDNFRTKFKEKNTFSKLLVWIETLILKGCQVVHFLKLRFGQERNPFRFLCGFSWNKFKKKKKCFSVLAPFRYKRFNYSLNF